MSVGAIITAIGSGLKLALAVVTGRNAKAERLNTAEMRANVQGRTDSAESDKATATVGNALKTGDLTQIQKDAAE